MKKKTCGDCLHFDLCAKYDRNGSTAVCDGFVDKSIKRLHDMWREKALRLYRENKTHRSMFHDCSNIARAFALIREQNNKIAQLEAALTRARRPVPTREQIEAVVKYYIWCDDDGGTNVDDVGIADAIMALIGGEE